MNISGAMELRHAVRQYADEPIDPQIADALQAEVDRGNAEGGLHMQLVLNEPKAFNGIKAHYGKFEGVRNYLALIGPTSDRLEELCGYYGERVVLAATMAGLDSCWVALTFGRGAVKHLLAPREKLACVVALGHGRRHGSSHAVKAVEDLSVCEGEMPTWFYHGMKAAQLAPTAMNQQKFRITCTGPASARIENLGGAYSNIDLGIVRYHFEQGAGLDSFAWDDPLCGFGSVDARG